MFGLTCCVVGGLATCACCVSSAACNLCCKTTSSTASRISYMLMFLASSIAAWIMLAHNIGNKLKSMEEYTGEIIQCESGNIDNDTCAERWSQLAVYRIFFGAALFFTIMAIIMIRVDSSKDVRSGFQNGFWLVKIIMWVGLTVAAFYIDNSFFVDAFGYIGITGAFMFMLVQATYLIIFANIWQKSFIAAEGNGGCARCCVPFTTLILMCGVIAISVILFVYYTYGSNRGGCHTNKGLISFNLVMMFVMAFFSIASQAEERGLFQASVVSFYTTYLTWSAVANTVDECQPEDHDPSKWLTSAIGFTLAMFVIGGVSNLAKKPESGHSTVQRTDIEANDKGEKVVLIQLHTVVDNEQDSVYYNWSVFHATLALGSLYMMNVISHWATIRGATPDSAEIEIGNSDAPLWVQAVASWITMLLYLWSILAPYLGPKLCPCREWPGIEG